ncbi:phospholipase A1-like [Harmonia axyridis]|uniref:phospholipase A1-like n=1 Tax=Harmonia axyridis TaxID=115357 RepID=UPI001E276F92|nr:phospholipase A1-like [Harmonia axyridis]
MNVLRTILCCISIELTFGGILPSINGIVEDVFNATKNATEKIQKTTEQAVGKVVNGTKDVAVMLNEKAFDVGSGIVDRVKGVISKPVNLNDLAFYVVSSKNPDEAIQIDYHDPGDACEFEAKTFFLIHGWRASANSEWIKDVSKILVSKENNTQVIQLDWEKHASDTYGFAAFDTRSIGDFVGILINSLITTHKIPRENIVVIGHSLGAQIAGWAGKKFQELNGVKLPRIIALDPAGPFFILRPDSKKLNKNDAEVVMVIHTDNDKLGYPSVCGTIDFFPNGGGSQPGCWSVDLGNISTYTGPVTCDHSRAWQLFREAVEINASFPARQCGNYSNFKKGKCDDNLVIAMSDLKTVAQGSFYLETNPDSPYSQPLKVHKDDQSEN